MSFTGFVLSPLPQLLKLGKMSRWVRNSSNPSDKVRRGRGKALTGDEDLEQCANAGERLKGHCHAMVSEAQEWRWARN